MSLNKIKGVLLDLNGVVFSETDLLPGALKFIEKLESSSMPFRYITNTTTMSQTGLAAHLHKIGLKINAEYILSPVQATVSWLKKNNKKSIHLVIEDELKADFREFNTDHTNPDVVIIGDIGERWNFRIMNKLFEMLMYGADLVALHKGRYWQKKGALHLDIGAIVAGLEYATGHQATVIGKPSHSFYEIALDELGLPAGQVVMIGDDIEADVGGAQEMGMQAILVKTGKYRDNLVAKSKVQPDQIIASIGELDLPG